MVKKVGVIFGGQSHEHEVSLRSVLTLLQQIDYNEFSVVPFLITSEGKWVKYVTLREPIGSLGDLWVDSEINPSPLFPWENNIDIFFPLIHGETGEDGKLQGLLEMIGIPYVGSNVEASAVGMNKVLAKIVANHIGGVEIVPYKIIRKDSYQNNAKIELPFDYPVFIKPSRAGSSVGVSKVYSNEELQIALKEAFLIDDLVLIEKAIVGKEIEVGVIGKEKPEASMVGEIEFLSDFYDYENKYLKESSVMHIPARIDDKVQEEVRDFAKKVYTSIGCEGYARVDFFLEENTNVVYFNEINTSPGMTEKSMFPVLFSNSYTFTELLTKIINNKLN
ncbi:D-alanine--D-alanine ligase family protein [Bacillus thuringiensis]|uniref:D-alanine--D-alanine ligase family protein n=1 Tax=Bacillus thuringiensis TaxID=1428 RepID=UPI0021D67F99|nr:D-alanine--D-alanine ligase family protein [Bacillus thuringiensis]MCU7667940.1 D-alanine--D-alanine ligase [Bacillus thuringiensis]